VEEIAVKSKINGIIAEVFVEVGEIVQEGQQIALVKNLSEPMDIENMKSVVNISDIRYQNALKQYEREKILYEKGLTSKTEFETVEATFKQEKEQLASAEKRLLMVTEGLSIADKDLSNIIYAPASGTILTLLIKQGSPVIKQNNYSEGTTLATIANMDSMMFYGELAEKDLGYFHENMPLEIQTQITENTSLNAYVTKIYPKGRNDNGVTRFPLEARLYLNGQKIWGGLSAMAIATVAHKDSVLYVEEKYLIYQNDSCYAWKKQPEGGFGKTKVTTGISNGLVTEVTKGIDLNDHLKIPE
jgi:HlyD family secretion protein